MSEEERDDGIPMNETLIGLWYVQLSPMSDWLCGVNMNPDGTMLMQYRFRYYDPQDPGNDPWSGKDKKSWWEGNVTGNTPEQIIEHIRTVSGKVAWVAGAPKVYETLFWKRPLQEAMKEWAAQAFVSMKKIPGPDSDHFRGQAGRAPTKEN